MFFMYEKKDLEKQKQIHFFCLEDLVPKDHLVRQLQKAIDFSFIYEEVAGLYKEDKWGKPGIDPVSLFKIVFIQYIFGIPSMRQTIREIEVNVAYRWFIGYSLTEPIPHFSTFGKNYSRRFKDTDIFERIFVRILKEAAIQGFVDARAIFIDSTHIKARANKNKATNEIIEKQTRSYQEQLEEEINQDRENHDKKPLKNTDDPPKTKNIKKSTTDPQSGLFHKGEHQKCFAYTTNTACDKNNFILEYQVAAGNNHDSQTFEQLYEKLLTKYPQTKEIVIDVGYKTPWIMKQILDSEKIPVTGYKRPMNPEGYLKKNEFIYDEYYDCVICPANQILKYSTTNREGYQQYKSTASICQNCQYLKKCTNSRNHQKTYTRHIWEKYMEQAEDYRHTIKYRELYKKRKETIERVFADAKEKHCMRYTQLRGLAKVTMQVGLTFLCMNLKKLAKMKARRERHFCFIDNIFTKMAIFSRKDNSLLEKGTLRFA